MQEDNPDFTFAVESAKVNKEYVFEFSYNKKRRVFPLFMRKTRSWKEQKFVFILESLTDITNLKHEIDNFSKSFSQKFETLNESTKDSFLTETYTQRGYLLILIDNYLQSKLNVCISGNRVSVENVTVLNGLRDALDTFLNKNRKITDRNYEMLISHWAEDEDYCINDSLEDPLNSNLDLFDALKQTNTDQYDPGMFQQIEELKKDIEFKDREIERLSNDYWVLKRLQETREKNEELYNNFLKQKNERMKGVKSNVGQIKNLIANFTETVSKLEDGINMIEQQPEIVPEEKDPEFGDISVENIGNLQPNVTEPQSPSWYSPAKKPANYSKESVTIKYFEENLAYPEVKDLTIKLLADTEDFSDDEITSQGIRLANCLRITCDISKISFVINEDIIYYNYPFYGKKIQYSGFLIDNKPEGWGQISELIGNEVNSMTLSKRHTYYKGSFKSGKIHGLNIKILHENQNEMFQGQMLKGKMIGNCKLSHGNCQVKYQGDIIQDEFNGQNVSIYNPNGTVIFNGDLISGKRQGKCMAYYDNSCIKYEGTFNDDKFDGTEIKEYYNHNILFYHGSYVNGKKDGFGTLTYKNGALRYKGNFKNNFYDGINIKIYDSEKNIEYSGDCVDEKLSKGRGKIYHSNGVLKYEGEIKNNEPNCKNGIIYDITGKIEYEGQVTDGEKVKGSGKLFHDNGVLKYEGKFVQGCPSGDNIKIYDNIGNLEYFGSIKQGLKQGKGIEYIENKMVYDGEFKDGLRHGNDCKIFDEKTGNLTYEGNMKFDKKDGPVKEYHSSTRKLKFEGIYNQGIATGKSNKLYDEQGVQKYEGEVKDGMKHGFGKMLHANGKLKYEGDFVDDKPNGRLCKIFNLIGKLVFEGCFEKGNKEGPGKEFFSKGGRVEFDGEFLNNKRHGKKVKQYNAYGKLIYEGAMENGERHGMGKEFHNNGRVMYDGEFIKGKYNGKGIKIYHEDGSVKYEGNIFNGSREGWGKLYHWNCVLMYEGEFKKDGFHGKNVREINHEKQIMYQGEMVEGKKNGYGKEYYKNGLLYYEGEFLDDEVNGKDIKIYGITGKAEFEGTMKNGLKQGIGKEYYENGKIAYVGPFSDDIRHGNGAKVYDKNGKLIFQGDFKNGTRVESKK